MTSSDKKSAPPNVIFDYDGVFVDTLQAAYTSSVEFHPGMTLDDYREMFTGNIYEALEKRGSTSSHHTKPGPSDPFFKRYIPKMMALQPVEGMAEMLAGLPEEYVFSIVSSTVEAAISLFLEMHTLREPFLRIYGSCTHPKKTVKLRRVLYEMADGDPDRAVYVTDTVGDVLEARVVGIRAIAVTWGFHRPEMLAASLPYALVHTPAQLSDAIRSAF